MSKKPTLHITNEIIQNNGYSLNSFEFYAYARLMYLYFRNYKNKRLQVNHKKYMLNIGITDTRTLKKLFATLFENKLIENEIMVLPKRNPVEIIINEDVIKVKSFTILPASILNWSDRINHTEFRLLFYYKSYINNDSDFCFAGYETICKDLRIGRETLTNCNEHLKKLKLLTVKKHKLESTNEYNRDDELVYNKYNNHYKILTKNL